MKCEYCNKEIDEDSKWIKEKKCFHFDCYVEHKLKTMKRIQTREHFIKKATIIYNKRMIKWNENKLKDEFWNYIQNRYDISLIPTYTFIKLNSITTGTYKGLNKSIPLQDIYDMFVKKENELDKIYANCCAKGKHMDNLGRFNYDLAVMIGKWDKYVEWKEKNKALEKDNIDNVEKIKLTISTNKIMKQNINYKIEIKDDDDLDLLADEI